MSETETDTDTGDEVRIYHDPLKDRSLSDAVLDAIAKAKGEDLTKEECALFDDIDPEAIDTLFRKGGGDTSVLFNAPDVGVRLSGGGDVEIRVASLTGTD